MPTPNNMQKVQSAARRLFTSATRRRRKSRRPARQDARRALDATSLESLEHRNLMTTNAIVDGDWSDPNTWDNGVPNEEIRAIVSHGVTVNLDGNDHFAEELVVHGDLVVPEELGDPTQVADARMKLYVNGELVGDAPGSQLWRHNNGIGIGGIANNTVTHEGLVRRWNSRYADLAGQIDKVATHNRALSPSEIETLFAADRSTTSGVPQQDIGSLWMFTTGNTANQDVAEGDSKSDNGRLIGDAAVIDDTLTLDGNGDYLYVGNSTDLTHGEFPQKSISLWFKVDATDGTQMIYEQGGHIRGMNVYLEGDTLYAGGWNRPNSESGWKGDWITQTGIVAGEWNHVVLTLDATAAETDKTLTTRWVHVNSGGQFTVGTEEDRFDEGTFTLNLTGTDKYADHVVETNMNGTKPGTMNVTDNDGFLMTSMGGRIQFYGQDKPSFTKLATTAEAGDASITVENVIERNYSQGAMDGSDFITSADDDGQVNWEVGDEIVIASSSFDYREEDVRTITALSDNGDGTSTLTLSAPLDYRHYGEIESYGATAAPGTNPASGSYEIDMRAEVALLSRNIKVQGDLDQDTDESFGDRARMQTEARAFANGLSELEKPTLPKDQVVNGVGGHVMIMPGSGQITVDGVQLDGLGQSSQKGRYPIHWHLGNDRTGDVLRNSSITNSNNRGVTIHGTSNLTIDGVVLHDIHGHGFFFEDAAEMNNQLVGNIALGIHKVGGNDKDFANPGGKDPFVVDTHDSVTESNARFESSAAFWITNPTNTFVGNISAGSAGTGFWYAIPRTVLGDSGLNPEYDDLIPIFAEFGQFDYNTSHSTPIGLNFDRGEDIEDGRFEATLRTTDAKNNYTPRSDANDPNSKTTNYVNGFTNYKASGAAAYHRGAANTILYNDLRVADSTNGPWAVSETKFHDGLYVGHSRGNAELSKSVGGPRLYDGAGLHTGAHFAGFAAPNADTFQVESSSFGPTMYHALVDASFEDDGTYDHISHAVALPPNNPDATEHDLGRPHHWIKAVLDLDGSLTEAAGGGKGYSVVADVDFLVDGDDVQPEGWDAWLTDDLYARLRVENLKDGVQIFPNESDQPLIRYTSRDGKSVEVTGGQNNGNHSWSLITAKADEDGFVEGTLTVEFLKNGVPKDGFAIHPKNQDGGLPALDADIQARVEKARLVTKIVAAGNYTPDSGTEVSTEQELRATTTGTTYYRDDQGNLYLNTAIDDNQPTIRFAPGAALQSAFTTHQVEFGTVIQAEAFDNGIQGIAYHDSDDVNTAGQFRADSGVDVSTERIVDIADGEWVEYTAEITSAAYDIGIDVASAQAGGQIRILAANSNSSGFLTDLGTVDVPNTGGDLSTVWLEAVDLSPVAGPESVVRLEFVGGGFEVDALRFRAPASQQAFVERVISNTSTTRVELEEFDLGGEGIAYHDTEEGNQTTGDFRRDEDVEATSSLITNQVFEGEWLEYTTDIQAGAYNITLRKAWGGANAGVRLLIGDANSASQTDMTVLGELTGDGEFLTLEGIDLSPWAGSERVLRIEIIDNWMGLDYLDFTPV